MLVPRCWLFLSIGGLAAHSRYGAYDSASYPKAGSRECGQGSSRHVCDPDGILSVGARVRLAKRLKALEQGPTFPCGGGPERGFQFAVALLESVHSQQIKQFTEELFNRWGIGDRECNNGLLLVLARKDRKNYLKTGPGAKGVLVDDHAADILASIRPELRADQYDSAIEKAVDRAVREALESGAPPLFYRINRALFGLPVLAWSNPVITAIVVVLAVVGGVCVRDERQRMKRQTSFEGKLQRLQEARRKLSKQGDCREAPCPVCLETLPTGLSFDAQPTQNGAELLRCGHVFHEACISAWLRGSRKSSCPVCRERNPRITGKEPPTRKPSKPASPNANFWRFAFDNLADEYHDVPGVQRMRRDMGRKKFESNQDLTLLYRLSANRERQEQEAERARQQAERARQEAERQHDSDYGSSGGDFGGGSCDGGGGAGGDW